MNMKNSAALLLSAWVASTSIAQAEQEKVIAHPVMKSAAELRSEGYSPRESDFSFVWSRKLPDAYEIAYRDGYTPVDGTWYSTVWASPQGKLEFDAGIVYRTCWVKSCKQTPGFSGRVGCDYAPSRIKAILAATDRVTGDKPSYLSMDTGIDQSGHVAESFSVTTQLSGVTFTGIAPFHNSLMGRESDQVRYDRLEYRFLAPDASRAEFEIQQGKERLLLTLGKCTW